MNKSLLSATGAFLLGGLTTGIILAQAQPAPPPNGPGGGPPHGPWERPMEQRGEMMRNFALIYHPDDRKLTAPEVKTIAEAFLLWNGNRTWKVSQAVPEGDVIGFDITTKEGSVIAHFTMDPKTGRLKRQG